MAARLLPLVLALLAGLAQAASMAWPLPGVLAGQPLWWLQLLSLGLLAWLVQRQLSWQGAALVGWLFATAWLSGTFWWLFISMYTYGGLAAPLAALAVLALAAFLALYYAAACAAWRALGRMGPLMGATVFAAAWTLAELARGNWFTGFPWGAGGYAHADGLLAGYAPWLGVYGLGAVAAWLAMSAARLQTCGRLQRVAMLALLVLPSVAQMGDPAHTQPAGTLQVALLQGNVAQDEKFQPGTGVPMALRWYGEQLRDARASLVVTPETAVPMLPQQLPAGYWDALRQRFASGGQAALVGIPLGSFADGYTNSVIGLKPGAPVYRFDKHHLVPFGEFIPPLFKWFTEMMNIPLGDFHRGDVGAPSFEWQGQQLAPNICYEDLFGEELGARFAGGAPAPTIFVNVSNIAWFGNTVAIDQHLQISRMRALEFGRPMIRATNTGATAIIDHRGVVTHSLARHTRGVLTGPVQGRTGATPFAYWVSRLGLWPLWCLGLLTVGWAVWSGRRQR